MSEAVGAAGLELAPNVTHLEPAPAVFEAMLTGWRRQQQARMLNVAATIQPRESLLRRFAAWTNLYPWQWTPAEGEAWVAQLRSGDHPVAVSTARNYEIAVRLFCEYLLDDRYGWVRECVDRFGQAPRQVFFEDNSVLHTVDFEGAPGRRPLTYDEVEALFDAADALVEQIRARGRKGGLVAARDAALLKVVYAFGLRRAEAAGLDVVDVRRNAKAPQFGAVGSLLVRYGKASRGGPPRRRTVLTVPEMDWVVDVVGHYLSEVRPALGPGNHPALWISERRGRVSTKSVHRAFTTARDAAGLDPMLDLHSLRHSYVTHLIEFDYPQRFVQEQVGHAFASTTAIYTGVSDEYRNRLLRRAMRQRLGEVWEDQQ